MPDERFSIEHLSQCNINKLFGVSPAEGVSAIGVASPAEKNDSSVKSSPQKEDVPDVPVSFQGFPPEPDDARLTVAGAIVDSFRKLERIAYVDLKDHFKNEAPKELHPLPIMPGINADEESQCTGLKMWSDAKGEGWIAANPENPQRVSWFNRSKWGSWRLAFLLARLQRAVWCAGLEVQAAPEKSQGREDDEALNKSRGSAQPSESTPEKEDKEIADGGGSAEQSESTSQKEEHKLADGGSSAQQSDDSSKKEDQETADSGGSSQKTEDTSRRDAVEDPETSGCSRREELPQGKDALEDLLADMAKSEEVAFSKLDKEEDLIADTAANDEVTFRELFDNDKDDEVPKRKRGRPKKQLSSELVEGEPPAAPDQVEEENETPKKKKRGRPNREKAASESQLVEEMPAAESRSSSGAAREAKKKRHKEPEKAFLADDEGECYFPPDPEDIRFSVEGAICNDNGKIQVSAYKDLMSIFEDEISYDLHPDPSRPGLRQSEIDDIGISQLQKGLRPWRDNNGRGWIASRKLDNGKTQSAWLSAVTLGSWRLALLLARLQIQVWESDDTAAAIYPTQRATAPKTAGSARASRQPSREEAFREADTSIPVLDDDVEERNFLEEERKNFARQLGYRRKKKRDELDAPSEAQESRGAAVAAVEHPGGKKVKPDASMDWRSRVLQERRLRRKGNITGSSFDYLGDVIDAAQASLQIEEDLRILTKASAAEWEASSDQSSTRASGAELPALTFGDTSLPEAAHPVRVRVRVGADDDEPSGHRSSSSIAAPSSNSRKVQRIAQPVPSSSSKDVVDCAGPRSEEDVDAAIKELLQVSEIY